VSYIPVSHVKVALLFCLMPCEVLQGLTQGSVFLQQVLLTVHKGVLQIARSDAPPCELAAVHPCLGDAVHPQLHRQTVKVIWQEEEEEEEAKKSAVETYVLTCASAAVLAAMKCV